jgi:hypothetical protein
VQRNEHRRRQEEEEELLRRTEVEEELKNRERSVEYSIVGCKVIVAFIIFEMCKRDDV